MLLIKYPQFLLHHDLAKSSQIGAKLYPKKKKQKKTDIESKHHRFSTNFVVNFYNNFSFSMISLTERL